MARKPAPQLSQELLPIRQVAMELRIRGENDSAITPDKALEMAAAIERHLDAVINAVIKARNALTYGAEYDPLDA